MRIFKHVFSYREEGSTSLLPLYFFPASAYVEVHFPYELYLHIEQKSYPGQMVCVLQHLKVSEMYCSTLAFER